MIKISGHSDDCIEIDGGISEEFYHLDENPALIACSDGTLVRVTYDNEGVWRVQPIVRGTAGLHHELGDEDGTDVLTLDGDVRWVVYTSERDGRTVKAHVDG